MKPAAAGGSVLRLLDRALPAFHIALTGAADAESGLRHILSDGRTGGGGCHAAHRDGCHQRGVGADEGTVTDPGDELVHPVVVAGNGAGTDIGALTDLGIADIGQVMDLGAGTDHRLLGLDEVADLGLALKYGTGAQPRSEEHTSEL